MVISRRFSFTFVIAVAFSVSPVTRADDALPDFVEYNRHVRPILSNACFSCHGPDANARKADLRLDVPEVALSDRDGVRAVVPGDVDASELVRRITHPDPEERMPPQEAIRTITERDIAILTKWVEQGAEYQPHWSYIAPHRSRLPAVSDSAWLDNPVDHFILRKLEDHGIEPSPEADPATLVRRLYFDLTGLPPAPEEADAFVRNPSEPAYRRLVDELLASPHYGERMAIRWLDLVRYADSNGYHSDEYRSIWPYRDYVVDAFNDNMPFDRFTVEQLAGDLLPDATVDQQIASGYNRLNQITAEGGAQAKEYLAMYAAGRVRTTATVWLGATMGCAQCHDHKFDPYTMKDFYSFAAFFADVDEVGVYTGGSDWAPVLPLPSKEQQAKEDALRDDLAEIQANLDVSDEELVESRTKWERSILESDPSRTGWMPIYPTAVESEGGATLEVLDDASVLSSGKNPERDMYTLDFETDRENVTGLRIEALPHPSFKKGLTREADFFVLTELSAFAVDGEDATPIEIESVDANMEVGEYAGARAIDGSDATGWLIRSVKPGGRKAVLAVKLAEPLVAGPDTKLRVQLEFRSTVVQTAMGRIRVSLTQDPEFEPDESEDIPESVYATVQMDAGDRTDEQTARLNDYFRLVSPEFGELRERLKTLNGDLAVHLDSYTTTLVTRSVEPRVMRVLPRGNWMDDSGEVVEPRPPEFLPVMLTGKERATRYELAQWLVNRRNPLTARVFVNRLWKEYFGTGLSKVLDDLGAQGEWPSHPDLLDWMAVEFMESGWDVKHMVRLIVTSAAYRQSSNIRSDLREIDPYNRLVARQARIRHDAEIVRDNALAVSGLLVSDIGGRSARPYQPEGYYAHLNFPKRTYETDTGKHLYRRGLYTHWQRSFLHPSLLAFDAPSREECTAERTRSNTPQQALVLLNDPIFAEAARVFAERVMREGGGEVADRIRFAVRQTLSRDPSEEELRILAELYQRHLEQFEANPESAAEAIAVGEWPVPEDIDVAELAAWTSVVRVILNLAETITRA